MSEMKQSSSLRDEIVTDFASLQKQVQEQTERNQEMQNEIERMQEKIHAGQNAIHAEKESNW